MFGENHREAFLNSLVSTGADQFRGIIGGNQAPVENVAGIGDTALPALARQAASSVPDMILAEDSGRSGEQITADISDFMQSAPLPRQGAVPGMPASPTRPIETGLGQSESTAQSLMGRESQETPAREIMRRRLNPFQIEKLAETIRERLESEMKVEKERRGEEP